MREILARMMWCRPTLTLTSLQCGTTSGVEACADPFEQPAFAVLTPFIKMSYRPDCLLNLKMTTFMTSDVNLGHFGVNLSILRCKKNAPGGHLHVPLNNFFWVALSESIWMHVWVYLSLMWHALFQIDITIAIYADRFMEFAFNVNVAFDKWAYTLYC
jgi:hypothetical protein